METNTTDDRQASSLRLGVVGTGALGSELCRLLIQQGHPNVLLIDPDQLEPHNIAMSALFRQAPLPPAGISKVELIRQLAALQGLSWDALQLEIADAGWADLARCDILICCADSVLARVETAGVARSLGLPMLEAAVASAGAPHGRVASFPAQTQQACYLCGLSEQRRAEVLAYALSTSLGCLPPAGFEAMTGTEQTLKIVAAELLQLTQALIAPAAFATRINTQTGSKDRVELSRNATCPWHQLPNPVAFIPLPFDEPLAKAFAALPPGALIELFWPICLRTRCTQCGHIATQSRRAALVRRKGVCFVCETLGTLEPLEILQSLNADAPQATQTPRQLGLPDLHLYYWRPGAGARERHTKHP